MSSSLDNETAISRRSALVRLGGFFGAVLATTGWKLNSPGNAHAATVSCVLTPEQTEGPYYIANEKIRRDITEHRPGAPLALRLKVVDASTCKPLQGALVEIWHCDAGGLYSGFVSASSGGGRGGGSGPTDKRTFLRGGQRSDASGAAVFKTIYPGWYRGRTVHIHVKVHLGGNTVHTGQLYFPDQLTDTVYATAPYSRRPGRDMRNASDGIFGSGGASSILRLVRSRSGYVGRLTMGVRQ
jgi:protocatechuate 3,4-dioxygenase beta subunit